MSPFAYKGDIPRAVSHTSIRARGSTLGDNAPLNAWIFWTETV